jgi:dTDP-4-amino-4,6-dideoxygalactose transaminase
MCARWSPHPRYRLYTRPASYGITLRHVLLGKCGFRDAVEQFECEICRRFNVAAAVCVPMARTGLYLALRELIRPGQGVVMSPLTIVDVVNMVLFAGGIPVFGDIRRPSCGLDPEKAESLIDRSTGAVLITHLHGETSGAEAYREICRRRGVPLIEDAAQAFGASENGRRLGTIGDIGIYSFGFYKNLNAWRGGMLVSPNSDLIRAIRLSVSRYPETPRWSLFAGGMRGLLTDVVTWPPLFAGLTHPVLRYSLLHDVRAINRRLDPEDCACRLSIMPQHYLRRMTPAQARVALAGLEMVDSETAVRIAHAALYRDRLASLERLILPCRHQGTSHTYTCFPIQCRERDALLRYAAARGRDFAAQHLRNCADLPEFAEFYRDCPNARAAARELILLPTYPRYPVPEIQRNIEIIQDFYRQGQGR